VAQISGVSPYQLSRESILAPASSSTSIAPGEPVRAALNSTVSPSGSTAFGSAPAASSRRKVSASPLIAARCCGVMP
jgi:hypothetical protein